MIIFSVNPTRDKHVIQSSAFFELILKQLVIFWLLIYLSSKGQLNNTGSVMNFFYTVGWWQSGIISQSLHIISITASIINNHAVSFIS